MIDRRDRRARDHIGRAWPDRRCTGQCRQSQVGLGEADCRMHHRLLIAGLVIREFLTALLECLADAADIAVAKDPKHRRDQPSRLAVALAVLRLQVPHDRLRHGQADTVLMRRDVHRGAISFRSIHQRFAVANRDEKAIAGVTGPTAVAPDRRRLGKPRVNTMRWRAHARHGSRGSWSRRTGNRPASATGRRASGTPRRPFPCRRVSSKS